MIVALDGRLALILCFLHEIAAFMTLHGLLETMGGAGG